MKKSLVLALSAVVAMFATSCDKDSSSKKTLDAEFTLTEQLGTVTYGQPVELEGTVISSVAITNASAVTAKNGTVVGTAQELKISGDKITGLVFIDSMDAAEITVTLGAGNKSKDFSFPIEKVNPAARKIVSMLTTLSACRLTQSFRTTLILQTCSLLSSQVKVQTLLHSSLCSE